MESLEKQFGLSANSIEKLKGEKKNWLSDLILAYLEAWPEAAQ